MQRVLVICGAGASSTFLVHWMRRIVSNRDLDLTVAAGSLAEVPRRLADTDVVLVGHHLAQAFPDIVSHAVDAGVRAELLPPVTFDRDGADRAVSLALGGAVATLDAPRETGAVPVTESEKIHG